MTVQGEEDDRFWSELARQRFVVQRCNQCSTYYFPPAPTCWKCGSDDYSVEGAGSGSAGKVYSMTTCYRSYLEFADQVPYSVVLGELGALGGIRVLGRLVGDPTGVTIGSEIELVMPADGGEAGSFAWRGRNG